MNLHRQLKLVVWSAVSGFIVQTLMGLFLVFENPVVVFLCLVFLVWLSFNGFSALRLHSRES